MKQGRLVLTVGVRLSRRDLRVLRLAAREMPGGLSAFIRTAALTVALHKELAPASGGPSEKRGGESA